MATNVLSNDPYLSPGDRSRPSPRKEAGWWESMLRPLASLKLTVVLFAMAIFIVFAGTVAQVNEDVWTVVHHYFRSLFTWIDLQIFFPRTVHVVGGFPFLGGWLIGALLIVNLLAAHALRFKMQARGNRLLIGGIVVALGILITWLVIRGAGAMAVVTTTGGPGASAIQSQFESWLARSGSTILWYGMKLGLAGLLAVTVYAIAKLDWARRLELSLLVAATVGEGILLAWLLYRSDYVPDPSSMRILWQLVQGAFVGLVLLGGCVLVFKKRAGIVLIHAGIALMMFNELYVGMTSTEAQMRLTPNAVQNFVEDIRTVELAVVDSSGKTKDNVVVVPKDMLLTGNVIHDDRLPFDIKVDRFIQNADIQPIPKDEKNPATAGRGLEVYAVAERPGAGADTDSKVDISAAYLTLLNKATKKPLGAYLVSLGISLPQTVAIDGKDYGIALRFQRAYKSYVVQLLDARKDNYPGTDTPRNYSSDIHLIDPSSHTDRDNIHIWMNNPLRYNGETFYQSGFAVDPRTGEKQTTLTVVANRGWMIPYIGCMIVAVGLLSHFLSVMTRFLRRRASGSLEPRDDDDADGEDESDRSGDPNRRLRGRAGSSRHVPRWLATVGDFFPWVAVAVLVGWAGSHAVPPRIAPDAMNLYKFGELPVVYEGRVKPFDTLARNALKSISGWQDWMDDHGHLHSADEWLLDVVADQKAADNEPIFYIDDKDVRDMLGITARQVAAEREAAAAGKTLTKPRRRSELYFSIAEFRDGLVEFQKQWKQADAVPKDDRNALQRQVVEFARRLMAYRALQDSFQPLDFPALPSAEEIDKDRQAAMATAMEIRRVLQEDMPRFHAELAAKEVPLTVPPDSAKGEWQPFATAIDLAFVDRVIHGVEGNPNTVALATIFHDYAEKDAAAFNTDVAKYADSLKAAPPKLLSAGQFDKLAFESFFNHFEPFFYGWILYLIAFVLACCAMLGWSAPLNRAAFWLVVATLVVHTVAMIGRIYISGRPPVTNLYSAALFIGWAGVALGLVLELVYRLGIGTMIASLAGFVTLFIAHFLAASGDTFTVMQAVLDTQFWLATHVVCITLGYATTFIAGLLGVRYVVEGVLTRKLTTVESKALVRMIYGVLCFAIFFSFVGTVLGGLWADDSWGRFWGWDPKENGALIIVIWNALVLHARWDGMVKDRGLAVLAIGGNIAVAWSGFGVNELGAGLHSYGFTQGVAFWLSAFVASQLALIVMGSLPKRLWRSSRANPDPATASG